MDEQDRQDFSVALTDLSVSAAIKIREILRRD